MTKRLWRIHNPKALSPNKGATTEPTRYARDEVEAAELLYTKKGKKRKQPAFQQKIDKRTRNGRKSPPVTLAKMPWDD